MFKNESGFSLVELVVATATTIDGLGDKGTQYHGDANSVVLDALDTSKY